MSHFQENLSEAIEQSFLHLVQKGDWIKIDYNTRVNVDVAFLKEIYAAVDRDRIKAVLAERIEQRIVVCIINSMETEIATDVKQILGNKELREDMRSVIREKMRTVTEAVTV